MNKGIIVISAGGHATVLIDAMQQQILETIVGIVDVNPALQGKSVLGISVLGDDGLLAKYSPQEIQLVNGLGSTDVPMARALLFKKYKVMGYHFHSVIHPQTIIATSCQLGEGVQVLAGGILQPRVQLADNVIINTRAIVDHDCVLAAHVHVATGAVISGNVSIGQNSHIGAGATILQGITIGENCLIGAGSVVIRDVPSGSRIAGVPARSICKREEKFAHEKLA